MIRFEMMCDKCLRILSDDESMYQLKLVDDEDQVRIFKGHEDCIVDIALTLQRLYEDIEKESNDEESN